MPLTARSALALLLLVWIRQSYGIERSDLILLVLGTGGIVLVPVSTLAVVVAAALMRLKKPPAPQEPWVFLTGVPFRTGFDVGWEGWLPLVRLELSWVRPHDVVAELVPERGRLVEVVRAQRRAVAEEIVRRWTISDTFGLARITFDRTATQALKIMPCASRLRPQELLHQMSSGDLVSHPGGEPEGDLIETRPYAHGDPLNRVLWKAFARTRRLLVRLPERAIAPRQKTLAYLVSSPGDEPAAGTARAALEQGVFGVDFLFCADGEQAPTREVPEAIEQIVRSAGSAARGGGLGGFIAQGQAQGSRSCVVFAPARPGPWIEAVEAQIRAHRGQVSVVLTVDGFGGQRSPLWRRLLVVEDRSHGEVIKELRAVWDRLVKAGAPVTVIDRSSGGAIHPSAMRG